jgi:Holliday junction resolvase RusA-like endonuclease
MSLTEPPEKEEPLVLPAKRQVRASIKDALGPLSDWSAIVPPIWVLTDPRSKSRHRSWVKDLRNLPDGQRSRYSPQQLQKGFRVYTYNTAGKPEAIFRAAVMQAYGDRPPYEGPVRIEILFAIRRPKWAEKHPERIFLSFRKPDFDNLLKLLDALNTTSKLGPGVWKDDQQIVGVETAKAYAQIGDPPHVELVIYGLKSLLEAGVEVQPKAA